MKKVVPCIGLFERGNDENNLLKSTTFYSRNYPIPKWLRLWSNKPDVVGLIPVTTEFFLTSCGSN